jgi:hypothetical protein
LQSLKGYLHTLSVASCCQRQATTDRIVSNFVARQNFHCSCKRTLIKFISGFRSGLPVLGTSVLQRTESPSKKLTQRNKISTVYLNSLTGTLTSATSLPASRPCRSRVARYGITCMHAYTHLPLRPKNFPSSFYLLD